MVHRRGGEQCRDRHAFGRYRAVGQDQDVVPGLDRDGCLVAQAIERRRDAVGPCRRRPGDVERVGLGTPVDQVLDVADLGEIAVGQDRLRDLEPMMRADLVTEQVRPRPDHRDQRHHQFLADRVDRRVGDLREILLEVVVEQLRPVGERGDRRVGAHRADRVVALARHRLEEELDILLGVAERLLQVEPGRGVVGDRRHRRLGRFGQFLELVLRLFQPLLVGMLRGELCLDLTVVDDAAFLQVDQQHLARLEAPFPDDFLLRHRQHAGFRSHDQLVVVGDDVARRAQAVAVEGRADLAAVGEGDRCRPIPRLHQRRMILVEGAALGLHQRVRPRLRDQHHHRVRQGIAAADDQEFERVVDARRIRLAGADQRHHLGQIGAQQVRRHRLAARRHPVDVAAHRVDLAVMADEPIGVRQPPGGEGVGRKALMHQRQRRHGQRVAQIVVEALDLRRQQQPLVDHRAGREGGDVEVAQRRHPGLERKLGDAVQHLLPDRQDLALEGVLVGNVGARRDDRLGDPRHRLDYRSAEPGRVDADIAPGNQALALGADELLEMRQRDRARLLVHRQEAHRHGIAARRRQFETALPGPVAQQRVRHLDHHAGAVAHQRVGADRAAMVEVDQDLQPAGDDVVRFSALDVGHKADAARVVLVARIVEPSIASQCHP